MWICFWLIIKYISKTVAMSWFARNMCACILWTHLNTELLLVAVRQCFPTRSTRTSGGTRSLWMGYLVFEFDIVWLSFEQSIFPNAYEADFFIAFLIICIIIKGGCTLGLNKNLRGEIHRNSWETQLYRNEWVKNVPEKKYRICAGKVKFIH